MQFLSGLYLLRFGIIFSSIHKTCNKTKETSFCIPQCQTFMIGAEVWDTVPIDLTFKLKIRFARFGIVLKFTSPIFTTLVVAVLGVNTLRKTYAVFVKKTV